MFFKGMQGDGTEDESSLEIPGIIEAGKISSL